MPRRPNVDRRISDLVQQLKAALVAREQQRIEASVSKQVETLVAGLHVARAATSGTRAGTGASVGSVTAARRGNRKPRSAAFREAARKRMVAYWASKRRGKGAKAAKPAVSKKAPKAAGAKPSPGRLRQIAAMKAFWQKKKATKGETATAAAK